MLALDVDDAEAVFAQAVAAGAQVRQPLAEAFWGETARSARRPVRAPVEHRPARARRAHDEIVAAAARLFS